MKKTHRGFTIVELLIVIVVIAILAAISIVAYNGIQQRARASAASSALTQASKKIALWQIDNPDQVPDCDKFKELTAATGTSCTGAGVSVGDIVYQYTPSSPGYCITATNGSTSYNITGSSSPVSGGCAGHGQGGVAAITNLVTNPSFASATSGWTGNSVTVTRVTSPWSADSNGALQMTPTGQDSYASFMIATQPGKTYTILGTLRLEASQTGSFQGSAQQRNILPTFFDSIGTYLGAGGNGSNPSANTPGTYSHRTTVTAPATASQLRVRLYNGATTGGGTVYWDQIMVVEGTYSGNYADGTSQNWIWNGTSHAATSTGPPL